jgi:hypothetical protein
MPSWASGYGLPRSTPPSIGLPLPLSRRVNATVDHHLRSSRRLWRTSSRVRMPRLKHRTSESGIMPWLWILPGRNGPVLADFWLTRPAVGLVIRIICDGVAVLVGWQTRHAAVHRTIGSIMGNPPAHFPAWPGDAEVAVALTFDLDGEAPWLSEGPSAHRSEPPVTVALPRTMTP